MKWSHDHVRSFTMKVDNHWQQTSKARGRTYSRLLFDLDALEKAHLLSPHFRGFSKLSRFHHQVSVAMFSFCTLGVIQMQLLCHTEAQSLHWSSHWILANVKVVSVQMEETRSLIYEVCPKHRVLPLCGKRLALTVVVIVVGPPGFGLDLSSEAAQALAQFAGNLQQHGVSTHRWASTWLMAFFFFPVQARMAVVTQTAWLECDFQTVSLIWHRGLEVPLLHYVTSAPNRKIWGHRRYKVSAEVPARPSCNMQEDVNLSSGLLCFDQNWTMSFMLILKVSPQNIQPMTALQI